MEGPQGGGAQATCGESPFTVKGTRAKALGESVFRLLKQPAEPPPSRTAMRIFTVHIDPLSAADDRGAEFLPEGFSWPAALFSIFWAIYHGLWDWALVLIAAGLILGAAVELSGLDRLSAGAVQIGFSALVGLTANDWRRWSLTRRGYRLDGIVSGDDLGAAEQRYFDRAGW